MTWPVGAVITDEFGGRSLGEVEQLIRNLDQEVACVFVNGEVVYALAGSRDLIDDLVPAEEQDFVRGSVVTHNHPDDDSFSVLDAVFAYDGAPRELRAIGPTALYVMNEPVCGWLRFDFNRFLNATNYWERVVSNDVSSDVIRSDRKWHTIWERAGTVSEIPYTAYF